MRRAVIAVVVIVIAVVAGTVISMQLRSGSGYQNNGKVYVAQPVPSGNGVVLRSAETPIDIGADPVEQAVVKLVQTSDGKHGASAIPKGTRLIDIKVTGDSATVNLSPEFNGLNDAGDTGESLAYNALRKALAQFPQIDKMTVMVDGKPYSGEHSGEWKDIPVRDKGARAGESQ